MAEICDALAQDEELLISVQLADDLLGCVALALHGSSAEQVWPLGMFSKGLVSFGGHARQWVDRSQSYGLTPKGGNNLLWYSAHQPGCHKIAHSSRSFGHSCRAVGRVSDRIILQFHLLAYRNG
jgi:hypothetical protein